MSTPTFTGVSDVASKWAIAAVIWIGIDVVLTVIGSPALVLLVRAPHEPNLSYWVSILTATILLFIVPGGLTAGVYLQIARRITS